MRILNCGEELMFSLPSLTTWKRERKQPELLCRLSARLLCCFQVKTFVAAWRPPTCRRPTSLHLPPPPSLRLTVTSPPVGLTLLNKASSKITPSCLSAQLRHKSFIKRRERRADRYQTTSTEADLSECECVCCFIFWLTTLQYQLNKDQPRSLTHILILFVPWKLDLLYQPLITYRITHISVPVQCMCSTACEYYRIQQPGLSVW